MSETENIVQTIKSTIQDLVAPDVRELKVRLDSVDKRLDGIDKRLGGMGKSSDQRFHGLRIGSTALTSGSTAFRNR